MYRTLSDESVQAIREASFAVSEREFVSIVGPSGCGKSTLLKIIAGLTPPSAGELLISGTVVEGPRRDIGVVFQNPVLLPWRNVLENALLGIEVLGLDRATYTARALDLLQLVGLKGFERKYPAELSGGMQQRCAIVRALLHDPQLLLMDEPFGALDALTRENMALELLRIWSASPKTVVFVTHSVTEALFLSDRVLVFSFRPGRILETVTVDLPRPRYLDMTGASSFVEKASHIRSLLGVQGEVA